MTAVIIQHLANLPSSCPSDASSLESCISALKSSISALESCIKASEGSSGHLETIGWLCAFAVGIGIAGEIVVIVSEHRDDLGDWGRGFVRPPDKPPAWRFWFDIVATLIVLGGVFGEAVAAAKIGSINSQLRSKTSELRAKSVQLLAVTTEEAGDAGKSAKDAGASAKAAGAAAKQAWEYAAWRTISDKQADIIAKRLAPLKGHAINVFLFTSEPETAGFAVRLTDVLKAHGNGMDAKLQSWLTMAYTGKGLAFSFAHARKKDFDLIAEALDAAGVEKASVLRAEATEDKSADNLLVNVGGKH